MNNKLKKPDYDRSILSISSSILKYYGITSNYQSLKELDKILEKKYKNVVFLILDCLGENIIKENLEENTILRKNCITTVTSVFPPTTAAATIAFHSGLSPYENGWVGWMPYFKEYNRMIELFSGKDYYTREKIIEPPEKGILKYKTIYEQICEKNRDVKYHKIFPNFDGNGYDTFESMCEAIKNACNNNHKNMISAYWNEPDHTIHTAGINGEETKSVIEELNENLEKLRKELKDTIIIISADHGAINVKEVYLNEIEEINDCLKMPPSIESRFVSFFIKKGKEQKFKEALEKNFKDKYILYPKDAFLSEKLLGKGKMHPRICDYIGDYVLISISDINFRYTTTGEKDKIHLADHGGLTKDEMMVPVITITC